MNRPRHFSHFKLSIFRYELSIKQSLWLSFEKQMYIYLKDFFRLFLKACPVNISHNLHKLYIWTAVVRSRYTMNVVGVYVEQDVHHEC